MHVQPAEVVLRPGRPLIGRFAIPVGRMRIVFAVVIVRAQPLLRGGVALVGQNFEWMLGFVKVEVQWRLGLQVGIEGGRTRVAHGTAACFGPQHSAPSPWEKASRRYALQSFTTALE